MRVCLAFLMLIQASSISPTQKLSTPTPLEFMEGKWIPVPPLNPEKSEGGYITDKCALLLSTPELTDDGFIPELIFTAIESGNREHIVWIGRRHGMPSFLYGEDMKSKGSVAIFSECAKKAQNLPPEVRTRFLGFANIR
jgi:hypothetical protein